MVIYIYALRDPRDGRVRYVGKTNNPKSREKNHFAKSSLDHGMAKTKWILELRSHALRPVFTVLEECNEETWRERERFWIGYYGGIRQLLNARLGGEIIPPRSDESYRAMGEKRKGIPRPPHVIEKVRQSRIGCHHSEETKAKLREANRIQFLDPEKQDRHSQGVKDWHKQLSPEKKERCASGLAIGMPLAHKALKEKWVNMTEEEKTQAVTKQHAWYERMTPEEKSAWQRGKMTKETLRKIGDAHRGKAASDEQKIKVQTSMKKFWECKTKEERRVIALSNWEKRRATT